MKKYTCLYLLLLLCIGCNNEKENENVIDDSINNPFIGRVYNSQENIDNETPVNTSVYQDERLCTALSYCPNSIVTGKYEKVDTVFDVAIKAERGANLNFKNNTQVTLTTTFKGKRTQKKGSVTTHFYSFTGDYTNENGQRLISITNNVFRVYDKLKSIEYSFRLDGNYNGYVTYNSASMVVSYKDFNEVNTINFNYSIISDNYIQLINESNDEDIVYVRISKNDEISLYYDHVIYKLKRKQ